MTTNKTIEEIAERYSSEYINKHFYNQIPVHILQNDIERTVKQAITEANEKLLRDFSDAEESFARLNGYVNKQLGHLKQDAHSAPELIDCAVLKIKELLKENEELKQKLEQAKEWQAQLKSQTTELEKELKK